MNDTPQVPATAQGLVAALARFDAAMASTDHAEQKLLIMSNYCDIFAAHCRVALASEAQGARSAEAGETASAPAREGMRCADCDIENGCPEYCRCTPAAPAQPLDDQELIVGWPDTDRKVVRVPDGVLIAIRNAGFTLLKTQYGYELRKLGPIEAHGSTPPALATHPDHPQVGDDDLLTVAYLVGRHDKRKAEAHPQVAAVVPKAQTDPNSREAQMVTVRMEDGEPTVWCDPEIADLVDALNTDKLATIASCSGHGHRPGSIALKDGRWLFVATEEQRQAIEATFPVDVNGAVVPKAQAEAGGRLTAERALKIVVATVPNADRISVADWWAFARALEAELLTPAPQAREPAEPARWPFEVDADLRRALGPARPRASSDAEERTRFESAMFSMDWNGPHAGLKRYALNFERSEEQEDGQPVVLGDYVYHMARRFWELWKAARAAPSQAEPAQPQGAGDER